MKVSQVSYEDGVLLNDRIFVLVDENGKFLSERSYPQMALISQVINGNMLSVSLPDGKSLSIDLTLKGGEPIDVSIWEKDEDEKRHCFKMPDEMSQFFSDYLKIPCMLLKRDGDRLKKKDVLGEVRNIALHDSGAIHIVFENSLNVLDLKESVSNTAKRFRPNVIVVSDTAPFKEDEWEGKTLSIGEQQFMIRKKTQRCTIPYVNPGTGEVDNLPKEVLEETRNEGKGIFFGVHMFPVQNDGEIKVGDSITLN